VNIDEFGQFRRKSEWRNSQISREEYEYSNQNTENFEIEEEVSLSKMVLNLLVNYFRRGGLSARLEQVLICILWIAYISFEIMLYMMEGLAFALSTGIFIFFICIFLQIIIRRDIIPWFENIFHNREYSYLVYLGGFIIIIITIWQSCN